MTDCKKIVFFTSFLGGSHGTAKSARDFLRSLLANHSSVSVVSPRRKVSSSTLCQTELATPKWFVLPKPSRFSLGPKGFTAWHKSHRAFSRLRHLSAHDIIIVNGWASYNDWQHVQKLFKRPQGHYCAGVTTPISPAQIEIKCRQTSSGGLQALTISSLFPSASQ